MPTTVAGLLIILFAILPGIPAYSIYKMFWGSNWRQSEWEKIVTIIIFSTGGLIIYTIISSQFNLTPSVYVIPSTFEAKSFGTSDLLPISLSLVGHFVSSIFLSLLVIIILRFSMRWLPIAPYPGSWDDFINNSVANRWVVVRLTNEETYAGILKSADTSVAQSDRDIILGEPALYSRKKGNYEVLPYQEIFVPATLVSSIAVVHDPDFDARVTQIGSFLFERKRKNGRTKKQSH